MTLPTHKSLFGRSSRLVALVRGLHPNFVAFLIRLCIRGPLMCSNGCGAFDDDDLGTWVCVAQKYVQSRDKEK
ncbi:hypothetical protein PoMZ_12434 [Pyricularia oryzae]|uniref:Uncharacterized protein n=1 Tax=Pyricularia oryzae TaxID=318829 RepID=A0A4P7NSN4_PYROR|nr:hypothetical protein PoMZ_12434 [Pyricularia oryzae]